MTRLIFNGIMVILYWVGLFIFSISIFNHDQLHMIAGAGIAYFADKFCDDLIERKR